MVVLFVAFLSFEYQVSISAFSHFEVIPVVISAYACTKPLTMHKKAKRLPMQSITNYESPNYHTTSLDLFCQPL